MSKALRIVLLVLVTLVQMGAGPATVLIACMDGDGCCDSSQGCHCVPCHSLRDAAPRVEWGAPLALDPVAPVAPEDRSPILPPRASDILHIPETPTA